MTSRLSYIPGDPRLDSKVLESTSCLTLPLGQLPVEHALWTPQDLSRCFARKGTGAPSDGTSRIAAAASSLTGTGGSHQPHPVYGITVQETRCSGGDDLGLISRSLSLLQKQLIAHLLLPFSMKSPIHLVDLPLTLHPSRSSQGSYEVKGAPNYLSLKNDETRPPYRSIEGKDLLGLAGGAMIFAGGVVKTAGVVNLGLAPLYFAPPVAAGVCLTYLVGSYETKGAPNDLPLKNDEARPPYRSIEGKGLWNLVDGVVKTAGAINLGMAVLYFAPPVAATVLTYRVVNYGIDKTYEAAGYVTEKAQETASYAAGYVADKAQEAAVNAIKDEINKKFS
ncbi:uncharacterized protein LOC128989553 [Macrosteles quadrilineatus]|uniref:uncharacterized protein LOC128989553 n=1 Tax=Macrosteles quadrilineatus TaxID=74068 RepID=UPI0023E0BF91|nr:uncharacterized protein LOC128989553 [Macrosteles quadrilineatus]